MVRKRENTLSIEMTFDATKKEVWKAWSQADQIASWWGHKGMEVKVVKMEFEEGGDWLFTMLMPNGKLFKSEGVYLKIIPNEKIISKADFKPMTEGIEMHISLEEKGSKTVMEFACVHPTVEYCKAQEEMGFYKGWGAVLENLKRHLSK